MSNHRKHVHSVTTCLRAPDFAETGEYLATVGGKTFRIVNDSGNTWMPGWKVADRHLPDASGLYEFLGKTRVEALETLAECAPKLRNPIRSR